MIETTAVSPAKEEVMSDYGGDNGEDGGLLEEDVPFEEQELKKPRVLLGDVEVEEEVRRRAFTT